MRVTVALNLAILSYAFSIRDQFPILVCILDSIIDVVFEVGESGDVLLYKSKIHAFINFVQVLNRARPEKKDQQKKTFRYAYNYNYWWAFFENVVLSIVEGHL